jgi:hypothetical protein
LAVQIPRSRPPNGVSVVLKVRAKREGLPHPSSLNSTPANLCFPFAGFRYPLPTRSWPITGSGCGNIYFNRFEPVTSPFHCRVGLRAVTHPSLKTNAFSKVSFRMKERALTTACYQW